MSVHRYSRTSYTCPEKMGKEHNGINRTKSIYVTELQLHQHFSILYIDIFLYIIILRSSM